MKETTLAKATRTFAAPTLGKGFTIKITAHAYQLNGNTHPHFSVTGEVRNPRRKDDIEMGGCLHDEAARFWPAVKPIIDLHLSNADDGEPMHAEANGFYWLAGACKDTCNAFGEQYHGGNSDQQHWKPDGSFDGYRHSTESECLDTLAGHLRISREDAEKIKTEVVTAYNARLEELRHKTGDFTWNECLKMARVSAKNAFHDFITAQRSRWEQEAKDGLALIQKLSRKEIN